MYSKAKIYKICSDLGPEIYIGSTVQSLSKRKGGHKSEYKRCLNNKNYPTSSGILFEKYGVENCKIILIEEYPCDSKEKMLQREQYYIDTTDNVNKQPAISKNYQSKTCECGLIISTISSTTHKISQKHRDYVKTLQ